MFVGDFHLVFKSQIRENFSCFKVVVDLVEEVGISHGCATNHDSVSPDFFDTLFSFFNQINHYFETGEILPDLTFEDKMKIAYEHLKRLINLKGENVAVREFRGLAPHYLRGTSGAAKLRGAISQASTLAEIEALLQLDKA